MKKSTRLKMGVAGTSLLMTIGAVDAFWASDGGASATDGKVLYGINRDSGQLFRYDFDSQSPSNVGVITDMDGNILTGIDASASIPGHQNIYGFWTDPDEGLVHLVYVNAETAAGTPVGDDLGQGRITGAVAAKVEFSNDDDDHADDDHDDDDDHADDDDDHDGDDDHADDDDDHDGDDDHADDDDGHDDDDDHADDDDDDDHDEHADDDEDDGDHVSVEVSLGWSLFAVQTLEAQLDGDDNHADDDDDDHDEHGDDDHADDDDDDHGEHGDDDHADDDDDDHDEHGDDDDDESTSVIGYRLIQVDHHSGEVTELMTLSRTYDGLATTDGLTFMGTSGSDLYLIDPIAQTETLVGDTGLDEVFSLEFADSMLIGFENVGDFLVPVDVTTGSLLGSPIDIGTADLGTIIFMNASTDPAETSGTYD